MRPRISVSNGSFQLSKRWPTVSFCGSEESAFVVALVMAWSPVRRVNAGRFEVKHPGDYATFNSNHSRDTTKWRTTRSKPTRTRFSYQKGKQPGQREQGKKGTARE